MARVSVWGVDDDGGGDPHPRSSTLVGRAARLPGLSGWLEPFCGNKCSEKCLLKAVVEDLKS